MLDSIQGLRQVLNDASTTSEFSRIGVELNTSCPNIPGHPPSAYDPQSLAPLLAVFRARFEQDPTLTIGLKLAPYVHQGQFQDMVDLLASVSSEARHGEKSNCVSFLSCTNTLGSSLVFQDQAVPDAESFKGNSEYAVPTVAGGLAGEPIHALSLGYNSQPVVFAICLLKSMLETFTRSGSFYQNIRMLRCGVFPS